MRTLYYVNAGASWFGFYLDEGALALANDGARFNSFGAVLASAGEHAEQNRIEFDAETIA